MFDAPVLEVTVSSAPTVIDSVSTINKIATLSTPKISSALLSAAAVLPQPVSALPDVTGAQHEKSANSEAQAILPGGPFQLLTPLNLSDVAESLEKIFAMPLDAEALSKPIDSENVAVVSVSAIPLSTEKPVPTDEANKQSVATAISKDVAVDNQKAAPRVLRRELSQCIDGPQGNPQASTTFQVLREGTLIGEVSSIEGADHVVRSLQELLAPNQLDPDAITPVLGGEQPAIRISTDVVVHVTSQVDPEAAENTSRISSEWAAITWSDQLRQDLGAVPLDAGDMQVMMKGLQTSEQQLSGLASWYGPYFHGRLTANGETFDQDVLTAAHKSLPFDTVLQVRNLKNNRSVVVRINDRGPYIGKRSLDLSKAAAQCLGSEKAGVIPYEAVILEQPVDSDDAN